MLQTVGPTAHRIVMRCRAKRSRPLVPLRAPNRGPGARPRVRARVLARGRASVRNCLFDPLSHYCRDHRRPAGGPFDLPHSWTGRIRLGSCASSALHTSSGTSGFRTGSHHPCTQLATRSRQPRPGRSQLDHRQPKGMTSDDNRRRRRPCRPHQMLKRQIYGRANPDLLPRTFLPTNDQADRPTKYVPEPEK
jgi:hypothetical protein